jgi:hypothetical protein
MNYQDRRREPRVDTAIQATLHGAEEVACRIANLSRSGAMAISTLPLPEMAQLKVRLTVPADEGRGESSLVLEAAVVRCESRSDGSYDLGLYFTNHTPASRAALETIVKAWALSPA